MGLPVLHQLAFSHYNEKARWALDYKGVSHVRETAIPGTQRQVSQELAGGTTLPVLVIDGQGVVDSTAIIALLEERFPDPPLYPADAEERRRALELEDRFDEGLGPASRRLFLRAVADDPELLLATFLADQPDDFKEGARAMFGQISGQLAEQFSLDDAAVMEDARATVRETAELWQREHGPDGYLIGGTFSVADLTLAALLSPIVGPEKMQQPAPPAGHPGLAEMRGVCAESGIDAWVRTMFERHRGTSAAVAEDS